MLTLVLPSTSREKFAPVTVLKVTFILPVLLATQLSSGAVPRSQQRNKKRASLPPP